MRVCNRQPPLFRDKQLQRLIASLSLPAGVAVQEKRVGRLGYTGIEVFGQDKEAGKDGGAVDDAVAALQSSLAAVNEATVKEWKRGANLRAALCWGTIFLFLGNQIWHFAF
jgi:hypothetical protein